MNQGTPRVLDKANAATDIGHVPKMLHEAAPQQPTRTRGRPLRDKQRNLSRNAPAARKEAKSPDRRVARTQRLLHEALIALVFEQGWDRITVQNVCARADVGRSTFYVYFADKEELLLSGFDQFERSLRAEVAAAEGATLAFVRPLLEHVRSHRRLYAALVGKRSGQLAAKRLLLLIGAMLRIEIAERIPVGPRREAVVRYLAGAFLELLTWWLDSRTGLPLEELEGIYGELTTPVLAALQRSMA